MTSFIDALNDYNEKLATMTIQEQVTQGMKDAMKNGDKEKRDFLRVVMSELAREGKELNDTQTLAILKKMKKDAIVMENEFEIGILEYWLPAELSEDETTRLIASIIADNEFVGMQSMGKVMAELKKHQGVDMKKANVWVKELLKNE